MENSSIFAPKMRLELGVSGMKEPCSTQTNGFSEKIYS